MKKRVFWSIFLCALLALLLTAVSVFGVLYSRMITEARESIRAEAVYVAGAADSLGGAEEYLRRIGRGSEGRITLIASDGTVRYDNFADPARMDNHLSRPEVRQALETGMGEATRLSDTLGENNFYCAIRLADGSVLRIANSSKNLLGLMAGSAFWLVLTLAAVTGIAMASAGLLTRKIIRPLNALDLSDPVSNIAYEELSPLLIRMDQQQKQIREQLRLLSEKQREFDAVTSNMSEGLILFGKKGAVLSANRSACEILGNCGATTYLQLCRDGAYVSVVEAALSGSARTDRLTRGGRVYRLSASPAESGDRECAAVLFIIDVTEREQSEQMRREFSANVSHELKTPLTSIMGCAEIIENGIAQPGDVAHFAGRIRSEANRLLRLIEDIIRLSRLDEQEQRPEFEPVELNGVCQTVLTELESKAAAAGVTLSLEGESVTVDGLRPVLHEMIYNLCDNAVTYNREGGSVKLRLSRQEDAAVLTVEDTGIGIAPEHQSRVFERFYRVDKSHSKATGGTGLGLSIVKHGAALHGAQVQLESRPGKGTCVRLSFGGRNRTSR